MLGKEPKKPLSVPLRAFESFSWKSRPTLQHTVDVTQQDKAPPPHRFWVCRWCRGSRLVPHFLPAQSDRRQGCLPDSRPVCQPPHNSQHQTKESTNVSKWSHRFPNNISSLKCTPSCSNPPSVGSMQILKHRSLRTTNWFSTFLIWRTNGVKGVLQLVNAALLLLFVDFLEEATRLQ